MVDDEKSIMKGDNIGLLVNPLEVDMSRFAQRIQNLRPEGAYQVLARAQTLEAEGREIIHLEIGEPDFLTPKHVRERGKKAIDDGRTRYNPPQGIQELRAVIAKNMSVRLGIGIKEEQVVVSPGAKPNLFFPALAVIEPGDKVIYPDPGFPTYEAMIRVSGGIPVPVPLVEENGFSFDLGEFDKAVGDGASVVILNSPGNPTGGVLPSEDLEHIAKKAQEYKLWVFSDEIYSRIVYDGLSVPSIASIPGMMERVVIIDGFSKTYAMTGWRLGFGVMPVGLADRVQLLLTHSIGCTAHFTQYAGLEALLGSQVCVNDMVVEYQKRRDTLVSGLNAIPGIDCQNPQGAFYVFPNVKTFGITSVEMANYLLEVAGVALLPGTAFGNYGEGYLRLAYANSLEKIELALEKIADSLARL
jgi:aspartate/methionine/tyrosine aminotransferase